MSNPLYDALFLPHVASEKTFLALKDGDPISFADFLVLAARLSTAFQRLGVLPGDRIALQARKSPEALAVYAACVHAGAVFLPLNTAYTPNEVEYFVTDAGARLILCYIANMAPLAPVAARTGALLLALDAKVGGLIDAADEAAGILPAVPRKASDLAALLYTSGTTGRSKGAMLTQENLLSNAQVLVDAWHFTSDDVLLHALPIFHTHGLFVATNVMLLAGGSMIFLPALDVDDLIAHLPASTAMMGVPTFYTRLLDDARLDGKLTRHMRLFISGSAPLLAETHRSFEHRTGHRILERYGMTETNMNTSNPFAGERRAGTVGFPLSGVELRIVTPETGAPVANGDVGVIEVRGKNVCAGYWNMPDKTKEEFRDDGFFITGDLGTVDADGYVTIVGRAKDLIIAGGYNIYPKEVEMLLDEQPGVLESAVIGVPHADLGEAVVGLVTARPGVDLDPQHLLSGMSDKLARFKQPRRLIVVDELPRNTMGKVQKNILRDRYKDIFTA